MLFGLIAPAGAASVRAQVCLANDAQEHEALADADWDGSTWAAPGDAQVSSVRFRVRGDCIIEIFVQGWGWKTVVPGQRGAYETTLSRCNAGGQCEQLDLRFRFAGGGVTSWIELESWYHAPAVRAGDGQPQYALDTLFPQPTRARVLPARP